MTKYEGKYHIGTKGGLSQSHIGLFGRQGILARCKKSDSPIADIANQQSAGPGGV